MDSEKHDRISRWTLIGLFGLVALALAAGGYIFIRQDIQSIREDKLNDLQAIAKLKCNQLVDWRNERLADARLNSTGIMQLRVLQWLKAADDATLKAAILSRIELFRTNEDYQNIILAAPDGRLLLAADPKLTRLEPEAQALVAQAVPSRQPVFGDFYRCPACDQIHLDLAAPILDEAQRPVAVLILRTDPAKRLYPLIQSWPLPSRSAETLLLRREGDNALFLNVLRHRPDPALTLRIPLTRTEVPSIQAALGKVGEFEGIDYRGVKVLADLRPVPGSPWFMVAKVDTGEILAEARYRGGAILLLVTLGILLTGGLTVFIFSYQSKNIYKSLFHAERERRQAQEEIRATLYGIGDGVIATDAAGLVTRMNPVAVSLTGWSEAEALGQPLKTVFQIINEETRAEVANPVECVLREGQTVELANHTLLIARDGTERPIADSGAPIHTEDGAVLGVVLVFRDQTAEREAQRALQESEQQYRFLFNNMLDGYAYCRMIYENGSPCDFVYLDVNDAFERMTGLKDVVGRKVSQLIPGIAQSSPDLFQTYGRVARSGQPERFEIYVDSLKIWFLVSVFSPVKDHFVSVFDNITERKRAFDDMINLSQRFQLATSSARLGVWDWNVRDNVMVWDDRMFELYGIPREAFPDSVAAWMNGLHPEDSEVAITECQAALNGERDFDTTFRIRQPDGTVKHIKANALIIRDADGKAERMIGINADVTDLKRSAEEKARLEGQLLQAQKMESVGRLAGGVAHDFNNMLGVILGHTEMALGQLNPAHPLHEDLEEIRLAAERSADLTRQLLAFARKQTVSPRVLDLNQTVDSMLKMLQRLIGEDIELSWMPGHGLWPVKMDPSQIDQILANLAINARDAISGVGHLTIQTENVVLDDAYSLAQNGCAPGDYVLLAISDTGAGMDRETLDNIFEPFFTTKEMGKGTGLGLAMVYGAIRQNHGFINVYSVPGQGTTFKIYLPRAEAVPVATFEASGKPVRGTETVLLAEDEESILKLGQSILKKHGYTVLAARTPDEALALAERHDGPIHLLITDVVMPEMNGKELMERLLEMRPEIRVLFMSGYTSDVIAHQGVLDEGLAFLQKPFTVNNLAQKVREVLL